MFRSSKFFAFAFSRHKTRSPAFELCSIYGGGRATGLSFPALGARTYTRGFAVDWVPAPAASHVGVRPRNQSRFAVVRQVPIIASNRKLQWTGKISLVGSLSFSAVAAIDAVNGRIMTVTWPCHVTVHCARQPTNTRVAHKFPSIVLFHNLFPSGEHSNNIY